MSSKNSSKPLRSNSISSSATSILDVEASKPETKSTPQLDFIRQMSKRPSIAPSRKSLTKVPLKSAILKKSSQFPLDETFSATKSLCDCATSWYSSFLGPTVDESFLEVINNIQALFGSMIKGCDKVPAISFPEIIPEEPEIPAVVTPEMVSEILQTLGLSAEMASAIVQTSIESIRQQPSLRSGVMQTSTPELVSQILQTIGLEPETADAIAQTSVLAVEPVEPEPPLPDPKSESLIKVPSLVIQKPEDKEPSVQSLQVDPTPPIEKPCRVQKPRRCKCRVTICDQVENIESIGPKASKSQHQKLADENPCCSCPPKKPTSRCCKRKHQSCSCDIKQEQVQEEASKKEDSSETSDDACICEETERKKRYRPCPHFQKQRKCSAGSVGDSCPPRHKINVDPTMVYYLYDFN